MRPKTEIAALLKAVKTQKKARRMTSRDFAFWAQGFIENSDGKPPTQAQWDSFKAHLNLVFIHEIDPSMGDAEKQKTLQEVHDEGKQMPGLSQLEHVGPHVLIRC